MDILFAYHKLSQLAVLNQLTSNRLLDELILLLQEKIPKKSLI
jgi:hypothetical protein